MLFQSGTIIKQVRPAVWPSATFLTAHLYLGYNITGFRTVRSEQGFDFLRFPDGVRDKKCP